MKMKKQTMKTQTATSNVFALHHELYDDWNLLYYSARSPGNWNMDGMENIGIPCKPVMGRWCQFFFSFFRGEGRRGVMMSYWTAILI